MSIKGRNTEVFTPTELGLAAIDATTTAVTTGNRVEIGEYDTFLIIINSSSGSTARAQLRAVAIGADGTEMTFNLRSTSDPSTFALSQRHVHHQGHNNGLMMGNDFTSPTFAGTMAALQSVKIELEVVLAGSGTIDVHLFCKRGKA